MSVLTGHFCETGHTLWYDDMNCNRFIAAGAFSINHCLCLCPFYSFCFLLFNPCVRQKHCRNIKVREQEEPVTQRKVWKSTRGRYCICCAQRKSSRVRIECIFAFLKSMSTFLALLLTLTSKCADCIHGERNEANIDRHLP